MWFRVLSILILENFCSYISVFKKIERNLRPVGKPIPQAADGNMMIKGVGALGLLGKRSVDEVMNSCI